MLFLCFILGRTQESIASNHWKPSFTYQLNKKNCTFNFTNTSTVDESIKLQGWLWDFGDVDGTSIISNSMYQAHKYSMQGHKHTVKLQLIFEDGLLSKPYELRIDVPICTYCALSDLSIEVLSIEQATSESSIKIRAVGGIEGLSLDNSGYMYSWRRVLTTGRKGQCFARTSEVKSLIAGTYEVQVTDGMGCKVIQQIEIQQVLGEELSSY